MGSLSKKVPYPRDNFLLSACQFMASSQGNGKFMEFVRLHGADRLYLLEITKVLPADTLFHLFAKVFFHQFVVLPICHHQSFPLYGIYVFMCMCGHMYIHIHTLKCMHNRKF